MNPLVLTEVEYSYLRGSPVAAKVHDNGAIRFRMCPDAVDPELRGDSLAFLRAGCPMAGYVLPNRIVTDIYLLAAQRGECVACG